MHKMRNSTGNYNKRTEFIINVSGTIAQIALVFLTIDQAIKLT